MDTRRQLIEKPIENIFAIKNKIMAEMHHFFLDIQITHTQWLVLRIVKKNESISIKELARLLRITSSAVTQIVDSLVNKDLLLRKRNPDDRRVLKMALTEKSKNKFDSIKKKSLNSVYTLFDVLNDDDLSNYSELNKKILGKNSNEDQSGNSKDICSG